MNILAEKQLKMLEFGMSESERKNREKAFYELYYKLREKEENSFWGRLSLVARKRLHRLVLQIYIIKNHLTAMKL